MEKYESLGLVGEGSYGIVIKCRNRETGRIVAVKKFLESEDDKTVKKIALREIRLLRQLRHENLVNLLEVWKQKRRWYLVFEFVERTILDELEQFPCGLELSSARFYLYQILRAVAFCHQHNIIHRDIKPENILVSQQGVIKLCDFGFARAMSAMPGESYTDYVATRWYRAPELLVGDTKYNKAVDVWAIGCLSVEMMTGMPLFPGDSDLDQLYHIIRCFSSLTLRQQEMFCRNPIFCGVSLPEPAHREPLHTRFPQLTGNAANFIQKCLQMDPERRPPCVQLLNHDLFTSDGFHIWFTLANECNSPQRDVKTCYAITERGNPDPSTEKRITGHKDPGPHDPNMVEGRAAQEGYCGVMPGAGSLVNQEGRSGVLREGRGSSLQEGSGELTPTPMTTKTALVDPHKPIQTGTAASRPPEMPPRNCPGAGIPSIPRIMSTAPALVPISLRSTDTLKRHVEFKKLSQQSMSSHISEARTGQRAAEHSMGPVRSIHCKWNAAENAGKKKGDVRFPELRNTLLPQHRAEGKHRKKETRIPSIISGDLHPCQNV